MLSKISRREQDLVLTASVIIVLFIIIRLIFFPALDRRQALTNQLEAKKDALAQMADLEKRYAEIQKSVMAEKMMVMKRDKDFTLFSLLDRLAQQSNVKANVSYMKPSTRKSENSDLILSNVKVKLDDIDMRQAVEFIYKIEASDNMVHIRSISLSKSGEEQKLTAIIETETIM
ncbi:MAG: type II secretion system protein M, partial [Desulfamplus sp.]|nr:type II secretion system protein M [Desulfamplus sp.]